MSAPRTHSCICGSMTWRIRDDARGTHLICYCEDCQTYGNVLDHGQARMDTDGGTEIFQTLPHNFTFVDGKEHLCVLRLGPKGILRWHSGCCGTQIANTLPSPGLPFVGAVLPPETGGYGPIKALLNTVGTAPHIKETGVLGAQVAIIMRILMGLFSKPKTPSPFFTAAKTPVVTPRVLTKSERTAARPG